MITREGMNGISASAATPGRHEARVSTSAGSTMPPPAWRSRFSSRIRTVTGSATPPVRRVQRRHAVEVREARSERRAGAEWVHS